MSRRTIGGGRILGSGKGLSPAVPPSSSSAAAAPTKSPSPLPQHVISPSPSTLSVNSSDNGTLTPPSEDIASRISLDNGSQNISDSMAAASALDRLVCPICSEEMLTLLQLNRHLDDIHKGIEVEEQDEVKDWFKQQMLKAKKFQPLAVLNQKLKGLDVFESNAEAAKVSTSGTATPIQTHAQRSGSVDATAAMRSATTSPQPTTKPVTEVVDPDELVDKKHWQRRSGYDTCSDPTCNKRLGSTSTGIVNCRHCGKLFCEEHTMYQMKLSRSAHHEPVRGYWCRVCETCYKSREGYNDRHGLERNRLEDFRRKRGERIDKMTMEVSRLEKRLTRLTQLLANPPEEVPQERVNKRWSLPGWGQTDPRKALEQSVVSWQNDADVARCPYCQQDFTQYTFRRHHCRTCGKVVCGDPATGCSTLLPLNVATTNPSVVLAEKPPPHDTVALDIRLCSECNHTLFSHRDFTASITSPPSNIASFGRSYTSLLQFERGIRLLLPKFQKLLTALQDPDSPPTSTQIADASRTRKRLMDSFTQYDVAARRIRDSPSESATQLKLQKAIYQQASQFLHLHMLPLKTLPKILKHATPHGTSGRLPNGSPAGSLPSTNGAGGKQQGALASIRYPHVRNDSSSNISISTTSSRISELEVEEKSLRERLIVLEEQKFMVQEMIADASRRRKFDEVASLAGNVEDLSREIDEVGKMVEGVSSEYRGVYAQLDAGG